MTRFVQSPGHFCPRTLAVGVAGSSAPPEPVAGGVGEAILACYLDSAGRRREVLARSGSAGSLLVLDRDGATLDDRRLVAHLPPDEPAGNAALICRHYLHDAPRRRCRHVTVEDTAIVPFAAEEQELYAAAPPGSGELHDRHGWTYRLEPQPPEYQCSQLRWCRSKPRDPLEAPVAVSVREVIGALESYRAVRVLTVAALVRHRGARDVSVVRLRAELERANASRILLNRGLRRAVLTVVRSQDVSLSEIASRCGRVKYDARGNPSGETSWLSRRVGLAPEGGRHLTTPWIHTEVLALIARRGLGLTPREVEVD